MKTKILNAVIADSNPDYGKMFAGTIKEIFNKVYLENHPVSAQKEINEVKPQVLFVNLNIEQRSNHLEMLEKINRDNTSLVIFGYSDSFEPEFLAHAVEVGVHDIFTRPFDPDIISTKINRYYQNELTQNRDLNYTKISPPLKAKIDLNFKVVSVDENGLTLKSPHHINKGTILPMTSGLALEMFESDRIELMVTKTWISEDWKDYFLYAEPKDSKEKNASSLRKFILSKL